ncbi:MAG: hypothetical protein QOF60_1547 [Actinomycetota bacterium]|jgi:uncharacterized protein involved in type VI secretion and phage assembly|nr:hypothetical protein [Actinomycetota bacterium]
MPTQAPTLGIVNFKIKFAGGEPPTPWNNALLSIERESTFNRPDVCTVTFHAPEVSAELVLPPAAKPGTELAIEILRQDSKRQFFKGEMTSIELESVHGVSQLVVRAYDQRHRLYRGNVTKTYVDMKATDIIRQMAGRAGIPVTVPDSTTVLPYALQLASSDGDYAEQLLHQLGWVSLWENDRWTIKALKDCTDEVATLSFGDNLYTYSARNSADSWTSDVEVYDWDPKAKKPVIGHATTAKAKLGKAPTENGRSFGAAKTKSFGHVLDQSQATKVADASFDRFLQGSKQFDGSCEGNEAIDAGKVIAVIGIDPTFNDKYRVSFVRHGWYEHSGFVTEFACNQPAERTITELISRAAASTPKPDGVGERIAGVVPAVVTDTKDPEDLGRVKVKYPWLPTDGGAEIGSFWVRVAMVGAGASKQGWYVVPEVSDEVLVAFEHGDVRRGYILGGLYNATDKPPVAGVAENGKTKQKLYRSTTGHQMTFDDSSDTPGFELVTSDKNVTLKIEEKDGKVTLTTKKSGSTIVVGASGEITIKSDTGGVTIEAMKDITMKAKGNIKLEATQNVDIKATMNATVEGTLNASLKGKVGTAVGDAGCPTTTVKGTLVQIN